MLQSCPYAIRILDIFTIDTEILGLHVNTLRVMNQGIHCVCM